ncbi:hypothetical protein D3C81_1807340 [compost metagenome]
MFLELRREARSGVATITTSSAEIRVLRIQPDQRWGRSSTTKGAVERIRLVTSSKASG